MVGDDGCCFNNGIVFLGYVVVGDFKDKRFWFVGVGFFYCDEELFCFYFGYVVFIVFMGLDVGWLDVVVCFFCV